MNFKYLIFLLPFALFTCEGSDDSEEKESDTNITSESVSENNEGTNDAAAGNTTTEEDNSVNFETTSDTIIGTWSTCTSEWGSPTLYKAIQDGENWEEHFTYYLDDSCQNIDSGQPAVISTGTYELGQTIILADEKDALEIDWYYDDESIPSPAYALVRIENGKFYLGKYDSTYDGSEEDKRSIEIDYSVELIREQN